MRLIDADVFEELFNKQIEYGATDIFDAVEDALQDTPTIDAVPVVHAEWIPSWEPLDLSDVYFRCSACRTNFNVGTEIDMEKAKYCPNCGAKMAGEEYEDD